MKQEGRLLKRDLKPIDNYRRNFDFNAQKLISRKGLYSTRAGNMTGD